MSDNLYRKIGEMEYDNLISGMNPVTLVSGGTIAKLTEAATYMRGTVFAKSTNDHMLYILGTQAPEGDSLTPDCILCDDKDIGTSADVPTAIYIAGCFNPDKVTVSNGYTMTEADKDKLRERGIIFKATMS